LNALIIVGLVAVFAPMAYRMIAPIPPRDVAAIESFLKVRGQRMVALRRMWVGGPGEDYAGRRRRLQTGRPYRVLCEETDGSRWTHVVAVVGRDASGDPALKERVDGVWRRVLE